MYAISASFFFLTLSSDAGVEATVKKPGLMYAGRWRWSTPSSNGFITILWGVNFFPLLPGSLVPCGVDVTFGIGLLEDVTVGQMSGFARSGVWYAGLKLNQNKHFILNQHSFQPYYLQTHKTILNFKLQNKSPIKSDLFAAKIRYIWFIFHQKTDQNAFLILIIVVLIFCLVYI